MYGFQDTETDPAHNAEEEDIESSIEKELESMRASRKTKSHFTPVGVALECVFFMKTTTPVEPDKLVLRMCKDARDCEDIMKRKTKYVNRLTPVLDTERATEKGIEKLTRSTLARVLGLRREESDENAEEVAEEGHGQDGGAHTVSFKGRPLISRPKLTD